MKGSNTYCSLSLDAEALCFCRAIFLPNKRLHDNPKEHCNVLEKHLGILLNDQKMAYMNVLLCMAQSPGMFY